MVAVSALPSWCRIIRDRKIVADRSFAIREPVRSPRDSAAVLLPKLSVEEAEVFVVLMLDATHHLIAAQEVTRGLVNSSLVAPREVFRLAIAMNASAIILGHNHPSNQLEPSVEDRIVTDQLVAAGRLLDIPVHDHLIVGSLRNKWYSFAEHGLL